MKNKLLLVPTTDFAANSFYHTYKYLLRHFDIYFLLEGPNITKRDYPEFEVLRLKSFERKEINFVNKVFFPNRLSCEISKLASSKKWHCVIVSNECGLHQSIIVKLFKKANIRVISHQVASGIVNSNLKNGGKTSFKKLILNYLYKKNTCRGYGYYSDEVWLMGKGWSHITNNKTQKIVPNGYYWDFKNIIEKAGKIDHNYRSKGKINITFFGGPLSEINLMDHVLHTRILKQIEALNQELPKEFTLYYKPHPQEKLYKKVFDLKLIKLCDLSPEDTLLITDIGISVSSSMSFQTKLLGKLSLGFWPKGLAANISDSSKLFFHQTFSQKDHLLSGITNKTYKIENADTDEFFNTSIDLPKVLKKYLLK